MNVWTDVKELFFPRLCLVCGKKMLPEEDVACFPCMSALPRTGLLHTQGNEMEKLFWGRFPIERASSLFFYSREGKVARILAGMKYRGRKDVCFKMGGMLADELLPAGFFEGVDCLIPVPLHPKRLRKRGYNQSEWLAKGIVSQADIPIRTDILYRVRNNETQTRKSAFERWANAERLFGLAPCSDGLKGCHVMLVDDVMTTGATLEACGEALSEVDGIRISVLTLAWTK